MSRAIFRTIIPALICFVSLAQDEPKRNQEWGVRAGSFQLSIASDRAEYSTGEAVRIRATIQNVSNEATLFVRNKGVPTYSMDVRLPMPEWIPFRPQARLTAEGEREWSLQRMRGLTGFTVPKDHEITEEFDLRKYYDMTQPGAYRITFACWQQDPAGKTARVQVVSNSITVNVKVAGN